MMRDLNRKMNTCKCQIESWESSRIWRRWELSVYIIIKVRKGLLSSSSPAIDLRTTTIWQRRCQRQRKLSMQWKALPCWIVLGETPSMLMLPSQTSWFPCLAKPFSDQNRTSCEKGKNESVTWKECALQIPVPFHKGLIISLQFIKNGWHIYYENHIHVTFCSSELWYNHWHWS